MQTCYITFMSQTRANQLKKIAHQHGISAQVVQTPKELSHGGCSYSLRCERRYLGNIVSLSQQNKISYSRIFVAFFDTSGKMYFEEY